MDKKTMYTPEHMIADIPDTIEDEMPPMTQAFYDKVHAEGGRVTHAGIVYDQPKPAKKHKRLSKLMAVRVSNFLQTTEEKMQETLHEYQLGPCIEGMIRPFHRLFKDDLRNTIKTRGRWWYEVTLPYFNKRRGEMRHIASENGYLFYQIDEPIGTVEKYYVVFKYGTDRRLTRFFFSAMSARLYWTHLKDNPENPVVLDSWGHKTPDSLRQQLEEAKERNGDSDS